MCSTAVSNYAIVKLAVTQLRPSEEINPDRARMLAKAIVQEGRWTQPLLVERHQSVIMDGHHRRFSAMTLNLSFVPCILLSYDDPNLQVTYWRDNSPANVRRIINAGLSGDLMKYKTTRHRLQVSVPSCSVALTDLK